MNIGTWTITDQFGNIVTSGGQLDLAATGLNEVLQNVIVILTTRIGSVMLDRRFGLAYNFVDMPQNKAELAIVQQMCVGLAFFEPRAHYKYCQFNPDLQNPGVLNVTLTIDINAAEILTLSQ